MEPDLVKEAFLAALGSVAGRAAGVARKGIPAIGKKLTIPGIRADIGAGFKTVGDFVADPINTTRRGWMSMSPASVLSNPALSPKDYAELMNEVRKTPGTSHLFNPSTSMSQAWKSNGAKGVAEELSRRGWTGKRFKYLPVGGKNMTIGLGTATSVPFMQLRDPETGSVSMKNIGEEVGRTALFTAAGPLGFAGAMTAGALGAAGGKAIGSGFDFVGRTGSFSPPKPPKPPTVRNFSPVPTVPEV